MITLRVEQLLRGGPWAVQSGHPVKRLLHLSLLLCLFGIAYGAVMGSYGGERFRQVVFSAVKVPLLLGATFALSLPSFFVINTLLGLRSDFVYALRALAATQAGLTVVLASFAPFTALWYVSFTNYSAAIMFNAAMFGAASITAQYLLRRFYRSLIESNIRHRWVMRVWLIIYAFVGVQMAWTLRPFIGDPDMPTSFFREDTWGNAYIKVFQIFLYAIRG